MVWAFKIVVTFTGNSRFRKFMFETVCDGTMWRCGVGKCEGCWSFEMCGGFKYYFHELEQLINIFKAFQNLWRWSEAKMSLDFWFIIFRFFHFSKPQKTWKASWNFARSKNFQLTFITQNSMFASVLIFLSQLSLLYWFPSSVSDWKLKQTDLSIE